MIFSGNILYHNIFRGSFHDMDQCSDLGIFEKFHRLSSKLNGAAWRVLMWFTPKNEAYPLVEELLNKQFVDESRIRIAYINALDDIQAVWKAQKTLYGLCLRTDRSGLGY